MALSPATYRFTVKDYHRMAEADIFLPKQRVELLDGEVFEMAPIGSRHAACVTRLSHLLWSRIGDRAIVSVQGPIQVGDFSQPQPDLAILRPRSNFYSDHHAMPPDVHLVIEVADSSLRHDLVRKAPLYVNGGVPEVWVVDLTESVIHVMARSGATTVAVGQSVAPAAFPDVVLDVADILGT